MLSLHCIQHTLQSRAAMLQTFFILYIAVTIKAIMHLVMLWYVHKVAKLQSSKVAHLLHGEACSVHRGDVGPCVVGMAGAHLAVEVSVEVEVEVEVELEVVVDVEEEVEVVVGIVRMVRAHHPRLHDNEGHAFSISEHHRSVRHLAFHKHQDKPTTNVEWGKNQNIAMLFLVTLFWQIGVTFNWDSFKSSK